MSHVFHRLPRHRLPVAVGGDGPWVIDADGRRYLDASGGAAVSCLGHDHPDVVRAIEQQLRQLPYAHTAFFTNEPLETLGEELTAAAPGSLDWAWFVSGGSEAVEAALKLARQYWLERGQPERRRFVARRQSYHGNTLGALAVGGNQWRRQPFEPLLAESHHIAPCYAYREQRADESDADYGRRAADELETMLLELGPDTVAAFVAETVVGATAGAVPPAPGYFRRIREICDRYGILLILDEVMCGMGRTGTLFACEQEGVVPDMITVAKGLGAGYQPIGALLVSDAIYGAVPRRLGLLPARAHLHGARERLRRRARRAARHPRAADARAHRGARGVAGPAPARALRRPPHTWATSAAAGSSRPGAGRGARREDAVPAAARHPRPGQARGHGARADVLPGGRHDRRAQRRARAARAAVHRLRGRPRPRRRAPGRGPRRGRRR
ncbi:MAG: aspartate aminotransferase family protein [Halofilum sp. (in: g-proteobacteria)]|nr:aspartate aminotransferase family protein [Halofilum sp. (in: g-proteobacteria)]